MTLSSGSLVTNAQEPVCSPPLLAENAFCGEDPGYTGTQSGALSALLPILMVPSGLFISMLAFAPSPVVVIEVDLPFSSVMTMAFLCGSNFMVMVLPVFLSRPTMVPESSLLETISVSGLMGRSEVRRVGEQ